MIVFKKIKNIILSYHLWNLKMLNLLHQNVRLENKMYNESQVHTWSIHLCIDHMHSGCVTYFLTGRNCYSSTINSMYVELNASYLHTFKFYILNSQKQIHGHAKYLFMNISHYKTFMSVKILIFKTIWGEEQSEPIISLYII